VSLFIGLTAAAQKCSTVIKALNGIASLVAKKMRALIVGVWFTICTWNLSVRMKESYAKKLGMT